MAGSSGAKKKKGPRTGYIKLVSPNGTIIRTKKNKRNTPERLELRKYDKVSRKHEVFKEEK